MCWWLPLVTLLLLSSQTDAAENVSTPTTDNKIEDIVSGIEEVGIYIGFSQCKLVKKIIGVDYKETGEEPDMSNLTLDYITKEIKIEYNLTDLSKILTSKWFNPKNGLIVYFHGFTDDPSKESFGNISDAYFTRGNFNIMALDSSSLIRWFYLRATTMVRYIGEAFGTAMVDMIDAGLKPSSIHLIGHSLGSHIASFTGKTLYNLTGYKVGRISGLDPAGPCFSDVDPSLRLNKTDADYVDVIHTDAGILGLDAICGHTDYYPNGGLNQHGCEANQSCSHHRAWLYFAESVLNTTGFPAVSCKDWNTFESGKCDYNTISYMGYASKRCTTGKYYLKTAADSPYALGTDGI